MDGLWFMFLLDGWGAVTGDAALRPDTAHVGLTLKAAFGPEMPASSSRGLLMVLKCLLRVRALGVLRREFSLWQLKKRAFDVPWHGKLRGPVFAPGEISW